MPLLAALSQIGTLAFVGLAVFDVVKGLLVRDNGKTKYAQTKEVLAAETGATVEEIEKLAAATMYEKVEELGQSPDSFWNALSEEARAEIKWSPEQLRRIEGLATFSAIATGLMWTTTAAAGSVTAIGAVVLSAKALQEIGTAVKAGKSPSEISVITSRAKFRGIKVLAIPSLVAGIAAMGAWLTPQVNNQLQDPGQWGRINLEQLENERTRRIEGALGKLGAQVPKTRVTKTTQSKPTLFQGFIFGGRVENTKLFERVRDDAITDLADLRMDAELNLNAWLKTLGGRLKYDISAMLNPFDEYGVKLPGYWAVLRLGYSRVSGGFFPLDNIPLGPLNPQVYMPTPTQTVSVQQELPKILTPTEIIGLQFPEGGINIFDKSGAPVHLAFDGASAPAEKSLPSSVAGAASAAPASTGAGTPPQSVPPSVPPFGAASGALPTPASATGQPTGQLAQTYLRVEASPGGEQFHTGPFTDGGAANAWFSIYERIRPGVKITQYVQAISPPGPFTPVGNIPVETSREAAFPRSVRVAVPVLFVRAEPRSTAALAGSRQLVQGTEFKAIAVVAGESVEGESRWWRSEFGNYVWVGGTAEKP